jgi:hypothetical protein
VKNGSCVLPMHEPSTLDRHVGTSTVEISPGAVSTDAASVLTTVKVVKVVNTVSVGMRSHDIEKR